MDALMRCCSCDYNNYLILRGMNLGDRRQRPYTWHKGIMEPYPNYEHGMVCPSCGLQRSRDVAHNCVNELRIELNKIKKEK